MASLYKCENRNQLNKIKETRGEKKSPPPAKKLTFKVCRKNTMNSLHEVEHFLRNFNSFVKYIKLYRIFR